LIAGGGPLEHEAGLEADHVVDGLYRHQLQPGSVAVHPLSVDEYFAEELLKPLLSRIDQTGRICIKA
jgi:hypothetical protein